MLKNQFPDLYADWKAQNEAAEDGEFRDHLEGLGVLPSSKEAGLRRIHHLKDELRVLEDLIERLPN